jgi:hypothetical protein
VIVTETTQKTNKGNPFYVSRKRVWTRVEDSSKPFLTQANTHQQTKEGIQMEELYSTEGDYGLRTLCEPDEAYVEYVTPYRYHSETLS